MLSWSFMGKMFYSTNSPRFKLKLLTMLVLFIWFEDWYCVKILNHRWSHRKWLLHTTLYIDVGKLTLSLMDGRKSPTLSLVPSISSFFQLSRIIEFCSLCFWKPHQKDIHLVKSLSTQQVHFLLSELHLKINLHTTTFIFIWEFLF